jgi:hypothetical protein
MKWRAVENDIYNAELKKTLFYKLTLEPFGTNVGHLASMQTAYCRKFETLQRRNPPRFLMTNLIPDLS